MLAAPRVAAWLFAVWLCGCNDSAACRVAGERHATGERFSAADGCNTCSCLDDGTIACTRDACVSAITAADAATGVCLPGNPACMVDRGCRDGDRFLGFGETFRDGCRSCRCENLEVPAKGRLICIAYCSTADEPCGPEERCDSCSIGERSFELGAIVSCPDGCNVCSCGPRNDWVHTLFGCLELERIEPCSGSPSAQGHVSIQYLSTQPEALALAVAYSGGCAPHELAACYEPVFLESSPPVVRIQVVDQRSASELCDVPLRKDLIYDPAPIRERFAELYGAEHGQVSLLTSDDAIHYDF
jgi:hypothetical protein